MFRRLTLGAVLTVGTAGLLWLVVSLPVWAEPQCATAIRADRCLPPPTQTIASGNTITDDGCGGYKRISAAGAVNTSTTETFTAPSFSNAGCTMSVCNVGANTITLIANSNFLTPSGANIAVTAQDCLVVSSDGSFWRVVSALVQNINTTTTSTSTTTSTAP